MLRMVEW